MVKILFLNYEYPPLGGGAANATKNIMQEMTFFNDVEIDIITSSLDEKYYFEKIGKNIRLHRLPIGKNNKNFTYQSKKDLIIYFIKAYFFSRKLHKEKKFDLSHSFFAVPCGLISLLLKLEFNLPYIISMRGSDVPGYSQRFKGLYLIIKPIIVYIWKKASIVVANSNGLKELALKSNPNQKIEIIYNGINIKIFKPVKRDENNNIEMICASRLSKRKGFIYVIEAINILKDKYANIHLTIAGGEGDAEKDLKNKVSELSLEKFVTFTGHYVFEEASLMYQKADIFVFPSFNEGMSNNMLEAMASGLPIIMTPTGGAEELIKDGKNGFIVNFADSYDIAKKIEKLILDKKLLSEMKKNSRAVAENMNWEKIAKEYFLLYEKILNKKR